jgi:hypothetical protein
MHRSISRIRLVILVPLALLITAFAAGSATAAAGPQPPRPDKDAGKAGQAAPAALPGDQAEKLEKQDRLLPVAHGFAEQARRADSDIAGVSIDVDAGVVHLYRKNTRKPLDLTGAPNDVKIEVHAAKFSRKELIDAAEQVTRDAQALGEQQVTVESVGPAVDGSGIEVSVLSDGGADLERASELLKGRYGEVVSDVNAVESKTSDSELYFNGWRFNDFSPWYGGDRLASSSSGCTSGFAAYYNGPAILTAAHCGGVGTNWYNGPRTTGGFNFMGTTVYSDTATDVAAIQASGSSYINIGYDPQVASQLYVGSWASPVVGEDLCQSGSYTGERCGLRVVDTAQYVCLSYVLWWCTSWQGPLADVISAYGSGSPAAGHGDSGGPVFQYTYNYSSGSWQGIAKGLVHGQLTPNARAAYPAYFPDNVWCPSPDDGSSPRCSSGFSFAHMPGY